MGIKNRWLKCAMVFQYDVSGQERFQYNRRCVVRNWPLDDRTILTIKMYIELQYYLKWWLSTTLCPLCISPAYLMIYTSASVACPVWPACLSQCPSQAYWPCTNTSLDAPFLPHPVWMCLIPNRIRLNKQINSDKDMLNFNSNEGKIDYLLLI